MRYIVIDKEKLNLWAIGIVTELEDMGFIDDEESLAKFKRILNLGIDLGMTVGRLTDEDLEEVIKEL